jgi:hypothetical protein
MEVIKMSGKQSRQTRYIPDHLIHVQDAQNQDWYFLCSKVIALRYSLNTNQEQILNICVNGYEIEIEDPDEIALIQGWMHEHLIGLGQVDLVVHD